MKNYRVNFGNGTVHYAGNLKDCKSFVDRYGDNATSIDFQDPDTGEWFKLFRCVNSCLLLPPESSARYDWELMKERCRTHEE